MSRNRSDRQITGKYAAALGAALVMCASLWLAGCGGGSNSSSSVGQSMTGGTLALTIAGLPSGVAGNVLVTGPNSYSQTLSSSQSLSHLTPGSYTLQINVVTSSGSNYYAATASQTVTVSNGITTSVQADYSVIAPVTTKVLDPTGSQNLIVSPDGVTFTMPSSSTVAQSLAVGDTLVVGVTTATHQGALRKILAVTPNGSQIVATTSQATLTDTFQQANFTFQGPLSPPSSAVVKNLRAGVRLIAKEKYRQLRPHGMDALSDPCAGNSATYLQMIDVPLAGDSSGTLTASGQVELCPTFQFNWSIGGFPPTLQSLTATSTFNADVHVNVTGRYDNSIDQKVPLLTITSDPITVLIGPVPIVLTPEATFFVGVSGEVHAGVSVGATQTAAVTAGISYANGQTSPVFTSTSNFAQDPLGLDASLSAKAYAGVTLSLNVEGVLTPAFSPDAYLNLDVNLLANPWWDITGGLEGSGRVSIGIFGVQLKDFEYPNLFNFSQTLAQSSGGFLTAAGAPVLQIATPNSAATGSQSSTLTIAGSNFVPGAFVSFNGQQLATTYLSPVSLTAVVPTSDLAVPGAFPVTATNPDLTGATSNALTFNVVGGSPVSVSVSPSTAQVVATKTQQFTATVTGTSNNAVTWSVNTIDGGNTTVGTIDAGGLYTAPAIVPNPATVTVTATSQAAPSASGSATVTVVNGPPVLTSVSPTSIIVGPFTLTVMGTGFLSGAHVNFGTTALTTTFVSSTQLTATGTATAAQAGTVPVTVVNPGPSTSNAINVSVVSVSGGSSGSTGIIVGTVNGQIVDEAYVPLPNSGLVAVVNVDAASGTNPVVTTIPMPNFYSPNATAADQGTLQIVVISYNSPDVQIIDAAKNQLLTTLTSPVTNFAVFSGGNCMVCGVTIDPTTNNAILDTAQGYLVLNLTQQSFGGFISGTAAGENFGYNPNGLTVVNPTYGQSVPSGLQAINLINNSAFTYSSTVGNNPDSGAVDINTNIAAVADEFTGDQYLINMAQAAFDSTASPPSFSAPTTVFSINFTDCSLEWTLGSTESSSHLLFLGTEFDNCAAVEPLPIAAVPGAPPTPTIFQWGHMPSAPDGGSWDNGGDPHGIAAFTSVVNGKPYGFLVRNDQAWVARVDLTGVVNAPPIVGGLQGEVDLTPFVTFFQTQ
jgi:hypothetical protein